MNDTYTRADIQDAKVDGRNEAIKEFRVMLGEALGVTAEIAVDGGIQHMLAEIRQRIDQANTKHEKAHAAMQDKDKIMRHASILLQLIVGLHQSHSERKGAIELVQAFIERYTGASYVFPLELPPAEPPMGDVPF